MRRTPLRRQGKSPLAIIKRRIQALLRELVTLRDGGCVLRRYGEAGMCSGPLQAEHLISRTNSKTFADPRNIVCLCQRHHIFWKPQNSRRYWELIEQVLGPIRWGWMKLAEMDKTPYRVDWALEELALRQEIIDLKDHANHD